MYHSKVILCGVNTSKLKVLTEEEKRILMKRVREGDEEARQEMITGNLRLVLSIVQRFAGRKENPDDLFQVGCIGLMKAIANFDPDKQVRFSTYGVPMIAGEVRRYLRDNSAIRVSRSIRDVAYRVLQCKEQRTLCCTFYIYATSVYIYGVVLSPLQCGVNGNLYYVAPSATGGKGNAGPLFNNCGKPGGNEFRILEFCIYNCAFFRFS